MPVVSKKKTKYTPKDREDAAVALSCTACMRVNGEHAADAEFEHLSDAADELMSAAFAAVPSEDANEDHIPWHEQWAEAESWVRTGWVPE